MALSAQGHFNLADTVTLQEVEVLRSVEKKSEGKEHLTRTKLALRVYCGR